MRPAWFAWLEGVDLDDPEAVKAATWRWILDRYTDEELENVWINERPVEANIDYTAPGRPAD
jgi:hypothetical protein